MSDTEIYIPSETLIEFIDKNLGTLWDDGDGYKFHTIHMQKVWNYQQEKISTLETRVRELERALNHTVDYHEQLNFSLDCYAWWVVEIIKDMRNKGDKNN